MGIEFSISDRQSPLWLKLREGLVERLVQLRKMSDHDLTEIETATLRGRIAELKAIISLDEERPHE